MFYTTVTATMTQQSNVSVNHFFHLGGVTMFFLPILAIVAKTAAAATSTALIAAGPVGTTIATGAAVGTAATTAIASTGIASATASTIGTIAASTTITAANVGASTACKKLLSDD